MNQPTEGGVHAPPHAPRRRDTSPTVGGVVGAFAMLAGVAFVARVGVLMYRARVGRASGAGSAAQAAVFNKFKGAFESEMTRSEAALILNVSNAADAKAIRKAHRTLMLLNHPDRGGSRFLASKVNLAKDLLVKGSK